MVNQVLEPQGDAVQGAPVGAPRDLPLGDACRLEGGVRGKGDEGAQRVLVRGDAVEHGAGNLHRGDLPAPEPRPELGQGQGAQAAGRRTEEGMGPPAD